MRSRLKRWGGTGLFPKPVSTSNLHAAPAESVLAYLGRIRGPQGEAAILAELAKRLAAYHHASHCVLFSTGFWALVAAIKLRARPGKPQVIIPSLTYRRLADVIYWAGLVPVFVDIDPVTLAISPDAVAANINEDTALILAVHPIVNCCDVAAITAIAARTEIPLVFDAVESAHETLGGRRIGSFGTAEVFSLHASKLINGLEGGYVCTSDPAFADALKRYLAAEQFNFAGSFYSGLNGLPHPGHAAFALAGLDDLQRNITHNRSIYERYRNCLADIPGIRLLTFDEREQTSYKNIVVEVQCNFPVNRDALVTAMNEEYILARKHYHPPLHRRRFAYPVITRDMVNTEAAETRYLNLPCGSRVSEEDVGLICDYIRFVAANSDTYGVRA